MSESPSPEHGTFLLHRNRGREHFEAEEYARARSDLELASSIRDDDPDVMYWLAMAYFRLDQHAEAEDMFGQLMKFRPGHASLHVNRGIALFKLDRTAEAEREFRQALELDGGGNRPHLYLGLTHARRAEYEQALRHFDEAGASMLASQMRQRLGWGRRPRREARLTPVAPEVEPPIQSGSPEPAAPPEKPKPAPVQSSVRESNPPVADGPPPVVRDSEISPDGAEVTVHGGTLLRMTFQGMALAQREALVGSAGSLSFERSARHEELLCVVGDGSLYLVREGRRMSVIPLRGEALHLVMDRFVASQGDLAREVSTAVEHGTLPLRAVGLRGNGMVGLSTLGRPLLLEVRPGRPATLSAHRVVGWMGDLQLSRAADDPAAVATGIPMVRFEGGGKVILDVPEGSAVGPNRAGAEVL